MKTILICSAAAAALVAGSAALAQAAPQAAMANKVLTRTDVQTKVRDRFARMDVNRDGVVTTDEMSKMRGDRKQRRMAKRAAQPNAMFDRIDANHDSMISRTEFASNRQARVEKRAARTADGKRMHGKHGGMRMMRMADGNKDGRITLAEAEGAALQHFALTDANHDGQVTRDERRQMHQRMRAERAQKRG